MATTRMLLLLLLVLAANHPSSPSHESSAEDDADANAACSALDNPSSSVDVMGSYVLGNRAQCERLCWYRSLCTSFSYCPVVNSSSSVGQSLENCVLHASSVQGAETNVSANSSNNNQWSYRQTPRTPSNGCTSRPCLSTDVCVPLPTSTAPSSPSNATFLCLPMHASCAEQPAQEIANGSLTLSGERQGDTATVDCADGFVLSPREADDQLLCQVNSRWTNFTDRCVQYLWQVDALSDVNTTFMVDFPLSLESGWGMCVRGRMASTTRMYVNFMSQPHNGGSFSELPLHLDLRLSGAVYDSVSNWAWQGLTYLGALPITYSDDYTLSIHINDRQQLNVTFLGQQVTYLIPMDSAEFAVDLTDVRHLWMGDDLDLSYVNLVSKCDEGSMGNVQSYY